MGWVVAGFVLLWGAARGATFNDLASGDWSTGGGAVWDQAGTPTTADPVVIDSHAITATNGSYTYQAQSLTITSPGTLTASRPLGSVGVITNNGTLALQTGVGTLSLGSGKESNDTGDWDIGSGVTLQLFDIGGSFSHTGSFTGAGNLELKATSGYTSPGNTKTIGSPTETFNLSGTTTIPSFGGYYSTYAFASTPLTFGNLTFANYSFGNVTLPAGNHTITGNLTLGYTGISGASVASTTLNVGGNLIINNSWMSDARAFQNLTLNVSGAGSYSSYMDRDNYFQGPVNLLAGAVFDRRWEFGGYGTGLLRGNGTWTINAGASLLKTDGATAPRWSRVSTPRAC